LNNIPTLEALLESGLGVTAMPALAFPRDGARGQLRYRALIGPVVMRDLFVVTRKGRIMSPVARELKDRILEKVGELGSASDLIELLVGAAQAGVPDH
jgi:DNA-binding transcriptional LysR family regulator